jgi:hypothetical protein
MRTPDERPRRRTDHLRRHGRRDRDRRQLLQGPRLQHGRSETNSPIAAEHDFDGLPGADLCRSGVARVHTKQVGGKSERKRTGARCAGSSASDGASASAPLENGVERSRVRLEMNRRCRKRLASSVVGTKRRLGPTETTVCSTMSAALAGAIAPPIGRLMSSTKRCRSASHSQPSTTSADFPAQIFGRSRFACGRDSGLRPIQ